MRKLLKNSKGIYPVPAIVSAIFPGVGQMLKGQFVKGLVFLGVYLVWGVIGFFLGLIPFLGGLIGLCAGLFLWAVNILDALIHDQG
jgi:TM2 domain-containing membrane protein YozV